MKRILLIISMLTCLCMLAACSETTSTDSASDSAIDESSYITYGEQLLSQIVALDEATMESYISGGQLSEGLVAALESWQSIKDEVGDYQSVKSTDVTASEDAVTITMETKFSKRDGTFTLTMDSEGNVTGGSFEREYSKSEIAKKALLNTLLGMGTVFVVLIFISFIISLFKYIPAIQEKFTKKPEVVSEAPAAAPSVIPAVEEDLMGDEQLVAVITAAVCAAMASENTAVSRDGLIVRSIRRSKK
ncbi:MAG: OadG family transporter subunit [Lachnospiraceae bacterium]|nr:OadG family transporter subunit [Lachnospiraceae bacterium]